MKNKNEMKQIMEAWRRSLQEEEVLGVRITTEDDVLQAASEDTRNWWLSLKKNNPGRYKLLMTLAKRAVDDKSGKLAKALSDKIGKEVRSGVTGTTPGADFASEITSEMYEIVTFFDPTGMTEYPNVQAAHLAYEENPTEENWTALMLAIFIALPAIGRAGKLVKGTKEATKKIDDAIKLVPKLKPKGEKAKEALSASQKVAKAAKKTIKATQKSFNFAKDYVKKYKNVFGEEGVGILANAGLAAIGLVSVASASEAHAVEVYDAKGNLVYQDEPDSPVAEYASWIVMIFTAIGLAVMVKQGVKKGAKFIGQQTKKGMELGKKSAKRVGKDIEAYFKNLPLRDTVNDANKMLTDTEGAQKIFDENYLPGLLDMISDSTVSDAKLALTYQKAAKEAVKRAIADKKAARDKVLDL